MPKARWPVASSDADFAPYLAGRPEASVAMFGRFIDLARAAGPVIFELQNGPVVCRDPAYFRVGPYRVAGLAGHINLMRHVTDRRIRKTEAFTASLVFDAYLITSMSDLNDHVRAVAGGSQGHRRPPRLSRGAPGRSGN